jgi:hypothetical protein
MSDEKDLRNYLKAAAEAESESLQENTLFLRFLDELDGLLRRLVCGVMYSPHPAAALLAINAHADFLAAISAALRGQSPPTFMLLRGAIESALYAFVASLSKENADIWINRADNKAATKKLFNANYAIQKLNPIDPNLAELTREAYDWSIEFGAHPNPRSVLDHVRFKEEADDGHIPVSVVYLHSSDSKDAARALSACVENGAMIIAILCHSIPGHPDVGTIFKRGWKLSKEFQKDLEEEWQLIWPDDGACSA